MKKKKALFGYSLTLGSIVFLLALIFLAPFLKSRYESVSALIYSVFSPVCHQIPSRSFFLFGHPLAVCGRCLGIYVGFLVATLTYPIIRSFLQLELPRTRTFVLFSLPIVLDTTGNFLHLWLTPNIPRFFLGFIWGLILPFYFIPGITEMLLIITREKERKP
ncbi:MAG: DUF2085 domain-containing protein [Candidatus Aminicenantales bacterium]